MPVDDFVPRVYDVLARADSLFGSASTDAGLPGGKLTDAADALRHIGAPDMSGSAVVGYRSFAEQRASSLARLAEVDTALTHIIRDAASAENTAAAASRSTVDAAGQHMGRLTPAADTPGGRRALMAALHSEVGHQQDLVRRHQHRATELAEQLRLLTY